MTSLKRSLADTTPGRGFASKVFLRSSRGKCVKVVRELYLRDDIPCSSNLCVPCTHSAPEGPNGKGRPVRYAAHAAPVADVTRLQSSRLCFRQRLRARHCS